MLIAVVNNCGCILLGTCKYELLQMSPYIYDFVVYYILVLILKPLKFPIQKTV